MKRIFFLMAAALAMLVPCQASLAAAGEMTNARANGDWVSSRLCFAEGCFWRAVTVSPNFSDFVLAVDFRDEGDAPTVEMHSNNVSLSTIRSWRGRETDSVDLEMRVDRSRIYSRRVTRTLERTGRTLYYSLSSPSLLEAGAGLGEEFVDDLRRGSVLRVRQQVSGGNWVTIRFSLRGAAAAIDRAARGGGAAPRKKKDDEFFDGGVERDRPGKGGGGEFYRI